MLLGIGGAARAGKDAVADVLRRCANCNSSLPIESFRQDRRTLDGVSKNCIPCIEEFIDNTWSARRHAELVVDESLATRFKECSICKATKPLIDYTANPNGTDGRNTHCRDCQSTKMRAWREANKDRVSRSQKDGWLRYTYDITLDEYNSMLETQGGGCAICGEVTVMKNGKTRLVVDHDHNTGATRGILCIRCNSNLSGLEQPGWLDAALRYLDGHGAIPTQARAA